MARKRRGDEPEANGSVAVADPPPEPTAVETPAPEVSNGQSDKSPALQKTRPAASFAANSDRTTRIEVAVWTRTVTVSASEEYTQYSLTLSRAWRDTGGAWTGNGFYRAHDVPVLMFLVQQAYHWCLAQRAQVRMLTDEPVPF